MTLPYKWYPFDMKGRSVTARGRLIIAPTNSIEHFLNFATDPYILSCCFSFRSSLIRRVLRWVMVQITAQTAR